MAGSYEDLTHALPALHTKLLNLWNSTLFHVAPVHEILSFTLGAGGKARAHRPDKTVCVPSIRPWAHTNLNASTTQ